VSKIAAMLAKALENATPVLSAAAGHPAGRFAPRPGRVPQSQSHSHPLVRSQPMEMTTSRPAPKPSFKDPRKSMK